MQYDEEIDYSFAKHKIFLAEETRESMFSNYKHKRYFRFIDDAYYTVFQLISAIMYLETGARYKKHSTLISDFNRKLIYEKGLFENSTCKKLNKLFKARDDATYYSENPDFVKEIAEQVKDLQEDLYEMLYVYTQNEIKST